MAFDHAGFRSAAQRYLHLARHTGPIGRILRPFSSIRDERFIRGRRGTANCPAQLCSRENGSSSLGGRS
jgi:hypothetical protein